MTKPETRPNDPPADKDGIDEFLDTHPGVVATCELCGTRLEVVDPQEGSESPDREELSDHVRESHGMTMAEYVVEVDGRSAGPEAL